MRPAEGPAPREPRRGWDRVRRDGDRAARGNAAVPARKDAAAAQAPARRGPYDRFDLLDGSHPWREAAPEGFVDYRAFYRPGGRVVWFNFPLAREMGLVPEDHPARMNVRLESRILETFSLQIVNEYDLKHPERLKGKRLKAGPYMATRYLQLQHKDKRGRTSGDGRSIWNGAIDHKGLRFDVSSRGTGATILSPGAAEAGNPLPTGEKRYGYADGRADLDEMLGSAIMSEIFYREGFPTERCLCVIDYGDGSSVGVRTAPNLVRPAHIFRYLKMGRRDELDSALGYFLSRQERNGTWKLPAQREARYARSLDLIGRSYGRLAAVLEEEYIFNWLAWDGDNVLADGSILDYGSIRQFAAKHDRYRYEDVDRFSTSLLEQRRWARLMVQAFAQAADFVLTGRKRRLGEFREAPCLREFDSEFRAERDRRMLWKLGFTPAQAARLMETRRSDVADFRRALEYFEDAKVARGPEKLPDGVTHRPVFLVRALLREMPRFFAEECGESLDGALDPRRFLDAMAATYASRRDRQLTPARLMRIREFQDAWRRLVRSAGERESAVIRGLCERASVINHEHRMTGNGLIRIINEILRVKDRLPWAELQEAMDAFIESQVLIPGKWKPIPEEAFQSPSLVGRLLRRIRQDLELYKETV